MKSFIHISVLLSTLLMGFANAGSSKPYYDKKEILSKTDWKDVGVAEDAPSHLSVISQGIYYENLHSKYDKNYYYPATAGRDIDVYMFDTSFNYSYDEFSDISGSIDFMVKDGIVSKLNNTKVLYTENSGIPDHGTMTSVAVAGKTMGVAKKANLHGVIMDYNKSKVKNYVFIADNIFEWLKYLKENDLIKKHKTVFNFSIAGRTSLNTFKNGDSYTKLQDLINEIANNGAVFVAGAANDGKQPYQEDEVVFPCSFDNVICVGGVGNFNITGIMDDEIDSSYYTLGKYNIAKETNSNYGDHVDIYAPFVFHYQGKFKGSKKTREEYGIIEDDYEVEDTEYGLIIKNFNGVMPGTSFSTPIVSGVAATLMSELPERKFTSASMLSYLIDKGEKNKILGIPDGYPNVFLNNGKKIVYRPDLNIVSDNQHFFREINKSKHDSDIEIDVDLEEVIDIDVDSDDEFDDEFDDE